MIEKQSNTEPYSELEVPKANGEEINLLDVFRGILSNRRTLYKAAGIGLIIGVIVALSIPKTYLVKVTLSPEMKSSKGGSALAGLAASVLGSGTTGGDGIDALNISLSADIVSSTPFLLELFDMKVITSKNEDMALDAYLKQQSSPWWIYVMRLPGMMIEGIKSLFSDTKVNADVKRSIGGTVELTMKEANTIGILRESITAIVDKKTGMTQVSVTLQDPKVSAIVADSVVHKLKEYIINYQTSKAKDDCLYLEKLFKERQQEYYFAQKKYANYIDTHDNLILQSVRTEQERLQSDMSLAYQVYSQVANQLQVARAKVQEEKPVFAIVEPAVVPLQPSSIGLKIYVLVSIFLSVVCTIGWILIKEIFGSHLRNSKSNEPNNCGLGS